jgi:PhzF family phenazine biosynthesis protein
VSPEAPGVPVHVVDAFADGPFTGNPAGVCLLRAPAPEAWMAAVAAEMRHSETAFVDLSADPPGLRWLTPEVEVDLCGHATLAAAHVLFEEGLARGATAFATRSGELRARARGAEIEIELPAAPAEEAPAPPGLAEALGAAPVWTGRSGGDLVVELGSGEEVSALAPDVAALASMAGRGVVVAGAGGARCDVTVRFFAPAVGIPEDPVTGSAQSAIAHRWAARTGRDEIEVHQASARGGRLRARPHGASVAVTGAAVTVLSGRLLAAPAPG